MPSLTTFKPLAWWWSYTAHDDPAVAVANVIALVVGGNLPFYPFYMLGLLGWHVFPLCLLTVLVAPAFLVLPWLSRRFGSGGIARLALPIVGTLNTLWCLKLLGPASLVGLFLLPCILLAALLFRPGEKWLCVGLATLALVLHFLPASVLGAPIIALTDSDTRELAVLNTASVATLSWLMALQFGGLLARLSAR